MSRLGTREKRVLESLLGMSSGYVLNFSDRTIGEFFDDELGIDFFDEKYNINSGSKANRMRGFWKSASDTLVAKSIRALCDYIEVEILTGNLKKEDFPDDLLAKSIQIANWLDNPVEVSSEEEDSFLQSDYEDAELELSKSQTTLASVLVERIDEIRKCTASEASLSAVILAGSTIEGLLLDCALANTSLFLSSAKRPLKRDGSNVPINEWTLDNLIKVGHDVGVLDKNVNNFSNEIRNFRNYIHPNKQALEGFSPNKRSANIAAQVLMACIENLQTARNKGKIA